MHRRARLNLVLMMTALAVGVVLFIRRPEPPPLPESVLEIEPANLSRISITTGAGNVTELRLEGQRWVMVTPHTAPAHPDRVAALLTLPTMTVRSRMQAGSADLRQLGLDPPAAILELGSTRVDFGSVNPLDQGRYLKVADQILVTADGIYPLLVQGPEFFIDTSLLPAGGRLATVRCGSTRVQIAADMARPENLRAMRVMPVGTMNATSGTLYLGTVGGTTLEYLLRSPTDPVILGSAALDLDYLLSPELANALGIPPEGCD